jgi:hypothetical protein
LKGWKVGRLEGWKVKGGRWRGGRFSWVIFGCNIWAFGIFECVGFLELGVGECSIKLDMCSRFVKFRMISSYNPTNQR